MAWFDFIGVPRLRARVQELEKTLMSVQELSGEKRSVLDALKESGTTTGGAYTTRDELIEAVSAKYAGTEKYGSELIQRLVNVRSAFTMSGGVDLHPTEEEYRDTPEMEFLGRFLDRNDLDGSYALALASEKMIEGQILVALDWVEDPEEPFMGYPRINFYSYEATGYEVTYKEGSPSRGMEYASWKDDEGNDYKVYADFATFMKFNSRISDEYGTSDFAGILHVCDNLSKGLDQWFAMNWLFAHPTPYFETDDIKQAADLKAALIAEKWKIGKFFAGPGKFSLVYGAGDFNSVKEKITIDAKIVSAKTGVPLQFMGFPDLLSNRSTSENMMEPVEVISLAEQKKWKAGFFDLFNKAIALYNAVAPLGVKLLKPRLVEPKLPFITGRQLQMLKDLYLPLYEAEVISLDTLLSKIPDVQAQEEKERLEADREDRRADEISKGAEMLKRAEEFRRQQNPDEVDDGTEETE